jgi:gliding motility-associated-like protein
MKRSVLWLSSIFFIAGLSAQSYYVNASSGDDANAGTSAGAAFKTIAKAVSVAASGNDIYIDAGNYSSDSIAIKQNVTFHLNGVVILGKLKMNAVNSNAILTLKGNANGTLDISSKLYLDSGYIVANATTAKLRVLETASQLGGSRKSFIRGGYHFQLINNSFSQTDFHVGAGSSYRKVVFEGMTRSSGVSEDYYAEFIQSSGLNVNATIPANTRNISTLGHWFVSKSANHATDIQIRFFYDSLGVDDQVYDMSELQILRSVASAPWTVIYKGGSANRVGSIYTEVMSNGNLGHFVLGNYKGGSNYQGGINTLGNTTDPFVKLYLAQLKECEEDTFKYYAIIKNCTKNDNFYWDFGDVTAYNDAGYVEYFKTTIPTSPSTKDTWAHHVFRVAGTFTVNLRVERNSDGKSDETNLSTIVNINPETRTNGGNWISYESYPTKGIDTFDNRFVCQGQQFWVVDKYRISLELSPVKTSESLVSTKIEIEGMNRDTLFSPPKAQLDTFKVNLANPNPYKIIVTRTTAKGCVAIEKSDLRIYGKPAPLIDFQEKCETPPLTTIRPTNNTMDPAPDNKVTSWDWHYKDSSVINQFVNKSYTFPGATPAPNLVKLVVRTDKGCVDSVTTDIKVHPKPIIEKVNLKNICHGETLEADPVPFTYIQYGGSIQHYIWNFDLDLVPNVLDSTKVTSYTYSRPDLYKIRFRVVSDKNCQSIYDTSLRIHPKPEPEYLTEFKCFGDTTVFNRVLKRYPIEDSMTYRWFINHKFVKQDTALKILFDNPGNYDVSLIGESLVGCKDSATGVARSFYVPKPTLDLDNSIAGNDSVQCFNANNFRFNYNFGLDLYDTVDVTTIDFGDNTIESPAVSKSHIYGTVDTFTVFLKVTNINGCADSLTKTVYTVPSPLANFDYEGVCMPDSVLFVDTTTQSEYPIVNRFWDFGDGSVDTGSVQKKHYYPNAGPFNARLIVLSSIGCSDTITKPLNTLVNKPTSNWALVGGSMPICKSDSVIFEALGGDEVIWQVDGDKSRQKTFRLGGKYYFDVINQGVCSARDSVEVFAYTPTQIVANPDTVIYRGRQVNLYVKNAAFNIKWTPTAFLVGDSTKSIARTRKLVDSITFYVSALDSNGCPDIDSVTITIIDPPLVKIPNIITPNGDNENETWNLIDIPDLHLYNIIISDRQGKRVYESERYDNDWAATDMNGAALPHGVYYYYMKNRVTNQVYRGYIQVIR